MTKTQRNFVVIASVSIIFGSLFGFSEAKRNQREQQLATYSYRYANSASDEERQKLGTKLQELLDQQTFSLNSKANTPGILDQLIACSFWANSAIAGRAAGQFVPNTADWDYEDFLFYCFYNDPGAAIY